MVWVALPAEEAARAIAGRGAAVSIAAVDDPRSVVLSGETAALDQVVAGLTQQGIETRALELNHALNSPQMSPLATELRRGVSGRIKPRHGIIPLYSTVTGATIEGEALHSAYWARNMRDPVRFAQAVAAAFGDGNKLFLEIGPHPVISPHVARCFAAEKQEGVATFTLRRAGGERRAMLDALGTLYIRGLDPDWKAVQPTEARYASIPTYPWQRVRHWVEGAPPLERAPAQRVEPGQREDAASRPSLDALRAAPPDERRERLEHLVREELARVLRVDPSQLDRSGLFYGYGFDSLMGIELRSRLETALGLKLSIADIMGHPRLDALAQRLALILEMRGLETPGDDLSCTSAASGRPAVPGSWIVIPRPSPEARLRLFCFPYSGGSAAVFGTWPGLLPPESEVCAIQPPGRHERLHEPLLQSVEEMVAALVPALLRSTSSTGPSRRSVILWARS